MTPAAFALAKRMLDADTSAQEREFITGLLRGSHFFEVTEVVPLAVDLTNKMAKVILAAGEASSQRCVDGLSKQFRDFFMPAQRTWVEWKADDLRLFCICTESGWQGYVLHNDQSLTGTPHVGWWELSGEGTNANNALLKSFVMLINTPKVIGRLSHECHKGLARELRKDKELSKFPLQGWTQIKLEVSKPAMERDGPGAEKRLTGAKCLHFCRKHLRVLWDGRWTIVTDHWRGNAALGIKQSRYVVQ